MPLTPYARPVLRLGLISVALLCAHSQTAQAQSELIAATEDGSAVRLPLVHESYRVRIDRQHATTSLRHNYRNSTDMELEGRFLLQAGDGAKVQGYSYWNGEEKIVGEVFEKETAADIYEEVTGGGRDPGLLEQVGEGTFSFRVFPIAASENKRIEVEYGKWLRRVGNKVVYRAPIAWANKSDIVFDISDAREIGTVTSSTHKLAITRPDATHVKVHAVEAISGKQAGDLELTYNLRAKAWSMAASIHRDKGHDGYLALEMASPVKTSSKTWPKDVTIVLDHSGSMHGEPMNQARLAAADIVKRLGDRDRLNITLFDDGVDSLYAKPKLATSDVRKEALSYIAAVRDEGGTNIALGLRSALAAQIDDDQPDVILFLTDGQSDSQATLQVAAKDKGDARVYTIGVGHGVAKPLLSRLAALKRGRFVFIDSAKTLTNEMAHLYSQIAEPLLVDLSLEVKGARLARTYPRTMPDLFVGDELRVSSRIIGSGPATIIIRGKLDGKAVVFKSAINLPEQNSRPWVGRLWAQSRTDDLLEEIALQGETDEMVSEITNLAVAYNFATPYTSFLAIPASELVGRAGEEVARARARKQVILAAHKDAAALSRNAMPPGDPVLSIRAPRDAQQVTAYFPFGLVKDLEWDENTEHWTVRFLVPNEVIDGDYDVRVVIRNSNGQVQLATIPYRIDSKGPEFKIETTRTAEGIKVRVVVAEDSRLVTVALVSDPSLRIELSDSGDKRTFTGEFKLPLGVWCKTPDHSAEGAKHQRLPPQALGGSVSNPFDTILLGVWELRVVVADTARNESDTSVMVELK